MNKQKVLLTFILFLAFSYVKGQDKIVTKQNDTIYCKIVSMTHKYIKFELKGYDQSTSYTIPMKQVREYSFGKPEDESSPPYVPVSPPPPVTVVKEQKLPPSPVIIPREQTKTYEPVTPTKHKIPTEPFPRLRIGFQGGGSYIINSLASLRQAMKDRGVILPEEINKYYNPLRSGVSFGADMHYLVTNSVGVGVKYSLFTSSTQMDYSVRDINTHVPTYFSVNEKERFYLNYLGPSFMYRQWLDADRRLALIGELSIGYIRFRDEMKYDPYQYVFVYPQTNSKQYNVLKEGNAFTGSLQLALDYYISPRVSVSGNIGCVPVTFRSMKMTDNGKKSVEEKLNSGSYPDFSRVDYSLGLHFHF